jgi:transcriptional regulator GlxA family with amidase domain
MTPPRHYALLLCPSFSNLCLAHAVEPLRAANQIAGQTLYRWSRVSVDGGSVLSSSRLELRPDRSLVELEAAGAPPFTGRSSPPSRRSSCQ